MEITRRIVVQAIQTEKNELIPLWDERIEFEKTEMYGNIIKIKGSGYGTESHSVIECIYDLKTKKLSKGIDLDFYPSPDKNDYKVDEEVYYETGTFPKSLKEGKIKEIVFKDFDLRIVKGSKMESYWLKHFKGINPEDIYAIKVWKPYYLMEDGTLLTYNFQMNKKFKYEE